MPERPLPESHPAFAAHFDDDLYDNIDDAYAPFGSAEGEELLREWGDKRDELAEESFITDLVPAFGDDLGTRIGQDDEEGEIETLVVAAGFTLLRLLGEIDEQDRQYMLRSLNHLEVVYGEQSEFETMREDLESFDG